VAYKTLSYVASATVAMAGANSATHWANRGDRSQHGGYPTGTDRPPEWLLVPFAIEADVSLAYAWQKSPPNHELVVTNSVAVSRCRHALFRGWGIRWLVAKL
jgi:hypothetical protein